MDNPFLTAALDYAARGWAVFPCHTWDGTRCSCGKPHDPGQAAKHPRTQNGVKDATTDEATLRRWWSMWPDSNIAVATGEISGIVVLDVDPRHGGAENLESLIQRHGAFPRTAFQHTGGGGFHYFFARQGPVPNSAGQLAMGLDVRGEGGYALLAPSQHESGRGYVWDMDADLAETPLAPWPVWMTPPRRATHGPTGEGEPILQGQREATLFRMAGAMRRHGATVEEILAALGAMNARCVPPLPAADLSRMAKSAGRYPPEMEATLCASHESSEGLNDLHDMLDKVYPRLHWLIQDLIPAGLTFCIGSPKSSKTYLAYSLALALAYEHRLGGKWLEQYEVLAPGPVVYFSLEDDEADSMSRIRELAPWLTSENVPAGRLLFRNGFNAPRLDEGLVEYLKTEIIEVYHPTLVVLDPVSYLMAPTRKGADQFSEAKDMLMPLRWLGKAYNCSILAVDHRRKKSADDVDIFETLQGSVAKTAVADSMLLLVREDKDVTIHARVRRAADQTLHLSFEFAEDGTARWLWKGAMSGHHQAGQYGNMRQEVMRVLEVGLQMSINDIMAAMGIAVSPAARNNVYQILFRAQKSGEVVKTARGLYMVITPS